MRPKPRQDSKLTGYSVEGWAGERQRTKLPSGAVSLMILQAQGVSLHAKRAQRRRRALSWTLARESVLGRFDDPLDNVCVVRQECRKSGGALLGVDPDVRLGVDRRRGFVGMAQRLGQPFRSLEKTG